MFNPILTFPRQAIWVSLALLGGCAAVVPPSQIAPSSQALAAHASPAASAAGIHVGQTAANWWQALHDPQLDALLQQAMQSNHQRQEALATVRAARSAADAAARDALPQGSLGGQAQRQQLSGMEVDPYRQGLSRPPAQNIGVLQQSLRWELDLFGRTATAAAVAERQADIRAADLHAATVLLQADVVRQYTRWQQARLNRQLLQDELSTLRQRHRQLQYQQQAGLIDPREVLAAASASHQLEAELAANDAAAASALAALAVLCGDNPLLSPRAGGEPKLPEVPTDTAIAYPHDLLARRPDVVRADAELRSKLGEAALADRAHLPHLSLDLTAGVMAPFGLLGNADALRYALGPAFSWDWLDAGRRAARRASAEQQGQAALHHYEQTVLNALQESETSLRQWQAAKAQLASARDAEALASRSASYSQARSQAGLEPQSQALAAHASLQQARRAGLAAHADAIAAYVQVQLALGAWQDS
ncbi:TolC family protein [Chromobacterium violaceum]|uniref:TolC family protein n=1 Tax=Chromobacterium violaceum TaxID=536 RepID=UPI001C8C9409|nr:TolC family protein [Chromobacterium violaceum]MBX9267979.1 TolC family protein [Chromobacterium violaceum]